MTKLRRPFNPGFLFTKVMKSLIFWSKHTKTRDYLQFTGVFIKLPLWSRFWWKVRKRRPSSETISLFISNRAQFRRCYVTTSVGLGGSAVETPVWTQVNRDKRRQIKRLSHRRLRPSLNVKHLLQNSQFGHTWAGKKPPVQHQQHRYSPSDT